MGKYSDVYAHVYSVFGSSQWQTEGIRTVPSNFLGESSATGYIRVNVVASGRSDTNKLDSVTGQVLIDIFVTAGEGTQSFTVIADKLDNYLVGKSFQTSDRTTQFYTSSLSSIGNDPDNPALYRMLYSIPFSYFGV